jgi:NADPH:quinone reductase-like Zn-dependent oxidoreductase
MDIFSIFPSWIDSLLFDLIIFGYPLLKFTTFVLKAIVKHLLPMPDLKERYCHSDKQSWAVVTGATDGIGLGFCKVLTKMGFNIVLISRNPEKLSSTVELLKNLQHDGLQKSEFKTIAFDFGDSSNKEKVDNMIK